jgi:hypothetical protein
VDFIFIFLSFEYLASRQISYPFRNRPLAGLGSGSFSAGWWTRDNQSHLSLAMPLRASLGSLAPSNATATATAIVIGRGYQTNPRRMCCCRPEHFTFTGTYSRCRTRVATLQLHFCSANSEAGKASEKRFAVEQNAPTRNLTSHHITSCPFPIPSRK